MKKRSWLLAAFLVAISAGCNRDQIADLILTVGFHPTWNHPRVDLTDKPTSKTVTATASQSSEQLLTAMAELRDVYQLARSAQLNTGRLGRVLNSIHAASEELLATTSLSPSLRRQIREAEFAALQLAAELDSTQFAKTRDIFRSSHFQSQPLESDNGESSALRILDEYLTASEMPSSIRFALNLHALTYPNGSLNVQLFSTAAERLTNEKQFGTAIQIAADGIRLCSNSPELPKLQWQLDRICAEQPGAPGLPFRLSGPTADDAFVDVADFRGKVVVATFWATWCPACREELNALRKLHDIYHREGVEFVGISLDENQAELSKYLKANGVTWPQIFVAKKEQAKWSNPIVRYYKVAAIPFTIVVDKQGRIVDSGLHGEANIENVLLDQLAH